MTWLICDYGEVISLPQPAGDLAAIEAAAGVQGDGQSFWKAYWRHRPSYDRADVTAAEYWRAVTGRAVNSDALEHLARADVGSWLHPNPDSISAVAELKERGVRLALFSNAPAELARELQSAPWLGSFSEKFFSCDLNAVKPAHDSYLAVLESLGAHPEEVVFVDDRPANVAGAQAVGIRAFVFEGPAQLARLV
ncbi:MAG TPA: HAD family phosphatase [Acidimicrobiales bacterium]|nr:HAD family phosphatase [Acidimicrobiales bacterium]